MLVVERLEDPDGSNTGGGESGQPVVDALDQGRHILDRGDRPDDHPRRGPLGRLGQGDLVHRLPREDGGDVVEPDGVEPVEEDPRAQHLEDGLLAAQRDRHHDAARIPRGGVDEDVVGAEVDECGLAALQHGPHPARVGHPVVHGEDERVGLALRRAVHADAV